MKDRNNKNNSIGVKKKNTTAGRIRKSKSSGDSAYVKFADDSLQGIIILQDQKIVYANAAFVEIIGFSKEELFSFCENDIIQLIHEPERERVWDNYKKRLSGMDIPSRYQIRLRSKVGILKTLDLYSSRFIYNNKPAIQAIFLDITQQIEASKALQENELKFRTIFEYSGIGMTIVDADGKFIRTNKSFTKLFGYSSEELSKLKLTDLTYPADIPQTLKLLSEFNKNEDLKSRQIEKRYYKKKGEIFWGLITVTAIRNSNGKVSYFIGQLQDITKRKNAEKELTNYADRLEHLNSSKDKFFSIISHDLRSPFNVLLGISEYASQYFDELSKNEVKDFITNIHSSAKKVYDLMQNLLEWAQGQLGKLEIEKSKIDLFELSENVVSLYKGIADQKKILLENKIEKNTFVYADRYTIETVIRNLVSNSVKFTNNGGSIIVSVKNGEDFATVTVKDTGIGISYEDQQKLFRIDEQVSTEGTSDEKGSGLGLILSKEFVELNGGKISVVSKINSGSKFSFTVPLFQNHSD